MKKRIFALICIILVATLMFGCASSPPMEGSYDKGASPAPEYSTSADTTLSIEATSRKIIYYYSCHIYTEDLNTSIQAVKDELAKYSGSYIQSSSKNVNEYSKTAEFTLRIKSEDLDSFLNGLNEAGTISNETLTSDDVTKNYYDLQAVKSAKEAELAKLVELVADAKNLSEILTLQQRITLIQSDLNSINSSLANYDSLVELSTVNISISQSPAPVKLTFGTKLVNNLKGAGKAIAVFLEYILYALIYIAPFAVVLGGFALLGIYIKKKHSKKSKAKKDEFKSDDASV